jgi:hypothetical protein
MRNLPLREILIIPSSEVRAMELRAFAERQKNERLACACHALARNFEVKVHSIRLHQAFHGTRNGRNSY